MMMADVLNVLGPPSVYSPDIASLYMDSQQMMRAPGKQHLVSSYKIMSVLGGDVSTLVDQ